MKMTPETTIILFLGVWFSSFYVYYYQYLKPWLNTQGITSYHEETISILPTIRNPDDFGWWIIPTLTTLFYFYAQNYNKSKHKNGIASGLCFFGMDVMNELFNVYILHDSKYAGLWMVKGRSCFVVLIGWNIEIILMFASAGLMSIEFLPKDENKKLFGFPFSNRWIIAFVLSWLGVMVEVFLNACDALIWCWPQWSAQKGLESLTPIWFFGYFHFLVVAVFVYDMNYISQIMFTVAIYTACIVFGYYLWSNNFF